MTIFSEENMKAAEQNFFERRGFHPDKTSWRDAQYGSELRIFLAGIQHAKASAPLSPAREEWEMIGEEEAKRYARELGGFPRGTALISVNGHTRGWQDCARLIAEPLKTVNECLASDMLDLVEERDTLRAELEKARAENAAMKEADEKMWRRLDEIYKHCACHRDVVGFDYGEVHSLLGKPGPGKRWLTPRDMIDHWRTVRQKAALAKLQGAGEKV